MSISNKPIQPIVKSILPVLFSLLVFVGVLNIENSQSYSELNMHGSALKTIDAQQSKTFIVPNNSVPHLLLQYKSGESLSEYIPHSTNAPINFLAQNNSSFRLFENVNFILQQNAHLNTLVFTQDKFHAQLAKGAILFDTRYSKKEVTVQLSNILIKPYLNGVYYLSITDNRVHIQIIQGNAELQVYNPEGELQQKLILPQSSRISTQINTKKLEDTDIVKPVNTSDLPKNLIDLWKQVDLELEPQKQFSLEYKGRTVIPTSINPVISKLSFNTRKKNYYSIASFYTVLNNLLTQAQRTPITSSDILKLQEEYYKNIANNVHAIDLFKEDLQKRSPFIFAITPDSNLYLLKLYLLDFIFDYSNAALILNQLADLQALYAQNDFLNATQILESLKKSLIQVGKQDSQNLITVLDNMTETVMQSNTKSVFQLRNQLASNLTSTLDQTKFRIKTQQHLLRLESLYSAKLLPATQVKGAVEELLGTLDSLTQDKYRDFLISIE